MGRGRRPPRTESGRVHQADAVGAIGWPSRRGGLQKLQWRAVNLRDIGINILERQPFLRRFP